MDDYTGELKIFLEEAGVRQVDKMLEDGMTLDILLQANENELAVLAPNIVDKIKIRTALDKLRKNVTEEKPVALPERQGVILIAEEQSLVENHLSTSSGSGAVQAVTVADNTFPQSTPLEISLTLGDDVELELLKNFGLHHQETGKNLRSLLSSETYGKKLLESSEIHPLTPTDRAYIVKRVVETELKSLNKINSTIRKDVWKQWTDEITQLFKGENSNLYYVPYNVVDGKIIQASGLLHNRLITHRRSLAPEGLKRKGSSSESDSNSSNSSSHSGIKRVRPLPDDFKVISANADDNADDIEHSSLEENLDWLRNSSSPPDVLIAKWQATLDLRIKLLESVSCVEYFKSFPALQLPNGFKLLTTDFEAVHPNANNTFTERFPIIKSKLLQLLAAKGGSSRVDQSTLDLLQLASVGEEQANVAIFLAIINLLRQMPTVCMPRKKVWRLSREEVRSSFLGRVSTASDIERFCIDREVIVAAKGIPHQPYILAVGSSWATVTQYEIVIHKGLRYQLSDICSAIKHTFNIYWALDCAYPKDSAPCWMFIQRTMFQMTSKYDTEGIPLRELLTKINA